MITEQAAHGSSAKSRLRSCAFCGQRVYRRWWNIKGWDVGKCKRCGLVQVLDDVSDDQLAALYGRGYYNGQDEMVYQDYLATEESKIQEFGALLDKIAAQHRIRQPERYLEIGCAYGLAMVAARNRGWMVRGIEVSPHAAGRAREKYGLVVDDEPNAIRKIDSESVELCTMWDVLEHVRDPMRLLIEIRRVLVPGGLLVFATVNIGSIGAQLYGRRWYLMAPPYHLIFPDRQTVRRMVEACGLVVKSIESAGGHPLENLGHNRLLQWVARNDRYIGWRLNSGPAIMVTAAAPYAE